MIDARRVGVDIGRVRLLSGVSLVARPGEVVALLGPSGAGKSTLLSCLNGQRRPDTGVVLYSGEDLFSGRQRYVRAIGHVPQDDVVHLSLSVEACLVYALRLRLPELPDEEVIKRVHTVLDQLELAPRRDLLVGRLSGGQRKRVSIGVELVASPVVMFLDEPTSGLDPALEERMMDLFATLAREKRTLMLTTHVMDSLTRVDQLALLYSGRLVFYGPPASALAYFKVDEPKGLFARLPEKAPGEWAQEWSESAAGQAQAVAAR